MRALRSPARGDGRQRRFDRLSYFFQRRPDGIGQVVVMAVVVDGEPSEVFYHRLHGIAEGVGLPGGGYLQDDGRRGRANVRVAFRQAERDRCLAHRAALCHADGHRPHEPRGLNAAPCICRFGILPGEERMERRAEIRRGVDDIGRTQIGAVLRLEAHELQPDRFRLRLREIDPGRGAEFMMGGAHS